MSTFLSSQLWHLERYITKLSNTKKVRIELVKLFCLIIEIFVDGSYIPRSGSEVGSYAGIIEEDIFAMQ